MPAATDHPATESTSPSIGRRCACYNLRRASRAVSRFYDQALAPSGLRSTQFSILQAAKARGPLTLTALAESIVTERTTLTRNIGLLERDGFIRVDSGQDRRERLISITEQGLAVLETAMPLWDTAQTTMERGLGQERLARLLEDLGAMVSAAKA